MIFDAVIVFGLILMSGFFSGSETALTSVSRAKIHKLKMEGNRKAIKVNELHDDKERLIGSILLGNNVVNIAASALATALAIELVGQSGVLIATAIMTVLVLIFAEVLPKTYAVRHSEQVALLVSPVLSIIIQILSPFTKAVQFIVNKVIALMGTNEMEEMSGVDVLRGTVEMYHEEGNFLTEDKNMLSGIFDLGDTEVIDIMIQRGDIASINIESDIDDIIRSVANCPHTRLPVYEGNQDNVIGILHAKDLFQSIYDKSTDCPQLDIREILREPWFVPETITLKNQLKAFQECRKHIALVVDEYGSVTGLITLEDILEEVVGDIEDEHDVQVNDERIIRQKDGTWNIEGEVPIRELNKELGWSLSDNDATTLAGYVLKVAQCIPQVDDIYEADEYMFKILSCENKRITKVKVRTTVHKETEIKEQKEVKKDGNQ